ncbi:MAG TPA: response regulator, partial [Candidatus Acidoferrum sp.]|nr:response regulator [Candidatus Acidoferrum sp.]
MIKILLVEDDASLREIYGVRLLAEGYDIVSASDGEEALAMAIKERPVLIITDIMMPKISGFDMLDILRSTTETKNIKVIVMTALGSEEQRARGDQLGADRYLVKSQVGIEDVVRSVHEVLGDQPPSRPSTPLSPTPPASIPPRPTAPSVGTPPASSPAAAAAKAWQTPPPRTMAAPSPVHATTTPLPQPPAEPTAHPALPVAPAPVIRNKILQPITDPSVTKVNINDLLDRELAREAGIDFSDKTAPAASQAGSAPQPAVFSGVPTV